MESSRSIAELKSSFIRTQVRILSESLEAPEDWRSYAAEPAEGDLSDKVVGEVLQKCKCNILAVLPENFMLWLTLSGSVRLLDLHLSHMVFLMLTSLCVS